MSLAVCRYDSYAGKAKQRRGETDLYDLSSRPGFALHLLNYLIHPLCQLAELGLVLFISWNCYRYGTR